jgi:2-polyprenyl-6-methoxyphenol hydroxylase-like FAD-dependent oxidoreductase
MSRSNTYDLIIVGGGIAGSSLACSMAKAGARVLLLESETEFRDRVRGEILCPWGVAEAHSLGLSEAFRSGGACEVRWLDQYMGPQQIDHRDLPATTLPGTPIYTFYHPRMQTSLLHAAESAGAEVRRGASVCAINQGITPSVTYRANGSNEEVAARLVAVAEGRNSQFRRLPGFQVQREHQTFCIAGVLVENVPLPDDTFYLFTNPAAGEVIAWAPEGAGCARTYFCYWGETRPRLQGPSDFPRLLDSLEWTGISRRYFSAAKQAGPLATFEGADSWVEHPYANGVALLGDAAANSDPSWGQGLSLALRGSRTLRDALLSNEDWDVAGRSYACEQNRFYTIIRTVTGWLREFFLVTGPSADARRAHALPLIGQDKTRVPDLVFSGPDTPLAPDARARLFGEDVAPA